EIVRQRGVCNEPLNSWIQSELLGIIRGNIVALHIHARQWIAVDINRSTGGAKWPVAPATHVAKYAVARVGGVDQAIYRTSLGREQPLDIHEEECVVRDERSANAAAVDVLHEHALAQTVEVVDPLIGIQLRSPIDPKARAMKFV